jgi:hypothetical protein
MRRSESNRIGKIQQIGNGWVIDLVLSKLPVNGTGEKAVGA